ncbi:MAG: hypothetical protein ACN6I4_01855 [bacterium]
MVNSLKQMKKIMSLLWCIGTISTSFAQVIITQLPPNPVRFSADDIWDINIINNGEEKTVFLKGILNDEFGKQIFDNRSAEFMLNKGVSKLNKTNTSTIGTNYNNNNSSAQIISQYNNLPYGRYNLCVYVYDVENDDILAESCIDHESQPVTPPTLITPDYCEKVNTKFPVFTWLAPAPQIRGQQVYYDFKLAEVYSGQSYEDAIQRNLAVAFASNLTKTSFMYPSNAQPLDSNKTYVWQVQAKVKKFNSIEVPESSNSFQHIGISEVWCLSYKKPELPEIIVVKKDITYAIPKIYEDAAVNVTNILYLSYREDYIAGKMNYTIFDSKGETINLYTPLDVKKGDNRYDINLKQTGLFKHKQQYKLVITNNNKETYYLNFKYIEE